MENKVMSLLTKGLSIPEWYLNLDSTIKYCIFCFIIMHIVGIMFICFLNNKQYGKTSSFAPVKAKLR
jgi:hypothetical protein